MSAASASVVDIAEKYYDSSDADEFYRRIWGGEDIHIGLYEAEQQPVRDASRRTVQTMAEHLALSPDSHVLDIGAGYGGAARYLAARFGCQVTCVNLSETQNERNRQLCAAADLDDRVAVVHGNFEALPLHDKSFDAVWSQDAILHSGDRPRVLDEVNRVLKPGGEFIFTDPMQADDCPDGVLGPVLDRIHLDSLGSIAFYRDQLTRRGMTEIEVLDLTEHLGRHYSRVREELSAHYDDVVNHVSKAYVDRMLAGLEHWVTAQRNGYLAWGILHFRAHS